MKYLFASLLIYLLKIKMLVSLFATSFNTEHRVFMASHRLAETLNFTNLLI